MSLAQGNNTPTRPRIEPGSPVPESDALTTRPVRPLLEKLYGAKEEPQSNVTAHARHQEEEETLRNNPQNNYNP